MAPTEKLVEIFLITFFGFLGLCLGSFATAVIYRENNGQAWYSCKGHNARSYCPNCKKNLTAFELVPLFSWLWLKGKCKNCKASISAFYPFTELVCGLISVTIFMIWGMSSITLIFLAGLPFVIALIYSGFVYKTAPQRLVLITTFVAVIAAFLIFLNNTQNLVSD